MPRRRGKRKYTGYPRRSNWGYYAKATAPAVGYVAMKMAEKVVKKYVNVEYKNKDVSIGATPDTSGVTELMSGLSMGDGEDQRDGDQIKLTSIRIKGAVAINSSANNSIARMMLICDRHCNGVLPGVTDILQSATYYDFPNRDNKRRFWIMWDKSWNLTTDGREIVPFEYYRAFKKGLKVRYTGTAGTITGAKENNLFLLYISSEATNTPSIDGKWRIRYIDN